MDFTNKKYLELLEQLKKSGYHFISFEDYCKGSTPYRYVIMRHDVDLKPQNSLEIASIEKSVNAIASYYFRAVPESWDENIIQAIHQMGHEVGYHYESLTTCNGDKQKAFADFKMNLEKLRKLVPVSTICMHGSPRSPYDSKDIWEAYDYKSLGIIGEPYLSTDFSRMVYLTDTGRCWDGYKISVRDKIEEFQEKWTATGWSFHSTDDIILALKQDRLPNQLMITTHPQRWNDNIVNWCSELLLQNLKNIVKRVLIMVRKQQLH